MPSTTPNRNYPFPLNPDRINVAGDIEALARAVDADVAGTNSDWKAADDAIYAALQADYIARDQLVFNSVAVNGMLGGGDGGPIIHQSNNLSIQGAYAIVALDGFAHAEVGFFLPWRQPPIVICNGAHPSMPQVNSLGGNDSVTPGSPVVSNTSFHIVGAGPNGGSMANSVVVFNWLAIGFLA